MNAPLVKVPEPQRLGLTADDFFVLAKAGAFDDYAKAELIEGELWVVNSVWAWHARLSALVAIELGIALRSIGSPLVVYGAGSVRLSHDSVPEPDISVGEDFDGVGLPLDAIRLAIEISDSTAHRDLGLKARLYGAAGIPEYWVFDRKRARIVQMWAPGPDGYAQRREIAFGMPVVSQALDGLSIDTAAIPA